MRRILLAWGACILVACAGVDDGRRGVVGGPALEQTASEETRDEIGVTTWRLVLRDARSMSFEGVDARGLVVGNGEVVRGPSAWIAEIEGHDQGRVEIEYGGRLVADSLSSPAMMMRCRDDLDAGLRGAMTGGCADEAPSASCESQAAGVQGMVDKRTCMFEMLDDVIGCYEEASSDTIGGITATSDDGGDQSTDPGGESGGTSGAGTGGSESGGSGESGSEGGGSGSGGSESGGYGTSGYGTSGGYGTSDGYGSDGTG